MEIPNVKGNGTERNVLQWNRKHRDYFKGNYLRNKILVTDKGNQKKTHEEDKIPHTRFMLGLPWQEIQDVMGLIHLVIIEYIIHLLLRRFQELMKETIAHDSYCLVFGLRLYREQHIPSYLTDSQLRKVIEAMDANTPQGFRDYMPSLSC